MEEEEDDEERTLTMMRITKAMMTKMTTTAINKARMGEKFNCHTFPEEKEYNEENGYNEENKYGTTGKLDREIEKSRRKKTKMKARIKGGNETIGARIGCSFMLNYTQQESRPNVICKSDKNWLERGNE